MYVAKIKLVAVMVLTVGLLGTGTGWILHSTGAGAVANADDSPNKGAEKKTTPKPPANETAKNPTPKGEDLEPAAIRAQWYTLRLAEKQAKIREAELETQLRAANQKVAQLVQKAEELTKRARGQGAIVQNSSGRMQSNRQKLPKRS